MVISDKMVEDQFRKGNAIYRITVRYFDRGVTAHMVMAISPEAAIIIANKHGIGYPMGRSDNVLSRKIIKFGLNCVQMVSLEFAKKRTGSVWYEDKDGKLQRM